MSYYDVDAILTDAQKLPCTFEIDVPGLGYLDGNPGGTVGHPQHAQRSD
jgi:GINS complex subunit 3